MEINNLADHIHDTCYDQWLSEKKIYNYTYFDEDKKQTWTLTEAYASGEREYMGDVQLRCLQEKDLGPPYWRHVINFPKYQGRIEDLVKHFKIFL